MVAKIENAGFFPKYMVRNYEESYLILVFKKYEVWNVLLDLLRAYIIQQFST